MVLWVAGNTLKYVIKVLAVKINYIYFDIKAHQYDKFV